VASGAQGAAPDRGHAALIGGRGAVRCRAHGPFARAWLVTVAICVIASGILLLSDYYGYAGVVLAVALAAAINLR